MFAADTLQARVLNKFEETHANRPKAHQVDNVMIPYQNFSILKMINKAKFPVYLAVSKIDQQKYAMKVFFYHHNAPDSHYKNEIRFASLKHPNVINILQHQEHIEAAQKGEVKQTSYVLMEYAPHGDFFTFILEHKDEIDEKLARTYFRQLIDGIEYLHKKGVAHLDLKPENLLLGDDFNLKIADFDLSFVKGDTKLMSRGTKYYRAPELHASGPSHDLKFETLLAADVYSAGVVLFVMKSGGIYPHSEDDLLGGVNFEDVMYRDSKKFWELHSQIENKSPAFYDKYFKDLFINMVKFSPSDRYTIKKVKKSKWYNGAIYNPQDFHDKVEKILHH